MELRAEETVGKGAHHELAEAPSGSQGDGSSVSLSERLSIAQIEYDLQRPIPQRLLKTKRVGGQEITYCPWHRVQRILDHYTGGFWEYEICDKTITNEHLLLTVRLRIYTREGVFYREGAGIEKLDVDSYGDPQSNAESQAFRRACARWGLGLHLYED